MIPRICANCDKVSNITNGQEIVGSICQATPYSLFKHPDDFCFMFSMAERPAVNIPDEQGETEEAEDEHEG